MKLFVTGGAGFIGSNLIKLLLKKNIYKVINYDALKYSANLKSLDFAKFNKNYTFYKGDITDEKKLKKVMNFCKPNIIINLAAESHVDRSIDNPAPFLNTNIFGTFTLLKICNEYWQCLNLKKKKKL